MKKRLLALCLAAAMLLGMMPALTLSTNAAEAVSTKQTQNVGAANIEIDGTQVVTSSDTLVRLRYYNVNSATAIPTWGKRGGVEDFYLDHTKEILFEENISINDVSVPKTNGTITIDEDGVMSFSGAMLKLVDNDTNSIVYLLLYRNADGKFCVNVLKADKTVGTLVTSLTGAPAIALQVLWAVDGSVTVTIGEQSAKVANATITRDATAEKGTYTNPTSNYDLIDADFIEWSLVYPLAEMQVANDVYGGNTFVGTQLLYSEFYVTHTEYLPAEMNSAFTAEELVADGALNEDSWKYASFEDLLGVEAAVLVNKGVAYVALKGADGEASVTLGGVTKTATIAGGVAEVAFENAVDAYGEVAAMTVNGAKANVTFAANAIDPVGTGTTLTAAICGSAATGAGQVKDNTTFYRFYGKGSSGIFLWYRAAGADFAIDRSKTSKIHVNMSIQSCFFSNEKAAFNLTAANAKGYATDAPNIAFTLKDEETDTFIYPFITGGENGIVHVGFFLNDQVSNEYVSLGVSNAGVSAGDSTTDLSQLYFVWNTDGSVTVMLGDEVKGTVKNATWTANDAYNFNRAQNPAFSNGVDVGADFIYIGGYGLAGQAYYYGLDVTSTVHVAPITTTPAADVAEDLKAALDLADLTTLPAAIEHDYLGALPLTWSDTAGLVENNILNLPDVNTETVLTAKIGDAVVFDNVAATVKGADPIIGAFTLEDLTAANAASWNFASFKDDVAVLVNKGIVYVGVKGADGDVSVTLAGETKTVSIVDGFGVVAFENAALTGYGEARNLTVGAKATKVVFPAKAIDAVGTSTTLNTDIFTSNTAGDFRNDVGSYIRLYGRGSSSRIFLVYGTADAQNFVVDRSTASKIHLDMTIQSCYFSNEQAAFGVTTSNGKDYTVNAPNISFTFKDYETGTFFYPYLTGGENGIIHVGFFLNDQVTNEYVSLGVSNAGVTAGDSSSDLSKLYFVWNTDGSVTVMLGDEVKGTVQNATWTVDASKNFNRVQNPAFSNGAEVTSDFYYIVGWASAGQCYFKGLDVTTTVNVVDIETSLADDVANLLDLDLTDLKDLPTSVEHDFFGTLNLTWSDDKGLVAENGKITVPADDTTIALTAKVGNTVILDAVAATVKAAEPVTGMFTTDVNAAWSSVEFAPLNGEGSVAVLAVNNNTVYVAVKSDEASATVTLGGVEKTVAIENGMGVVAFENVALAKYGEKRDLSVVTASGELTTKVVFEALQFTPATPGETLTAAICGSAATGAGLVKDNTTFYRFYGKGSSGIFLWYRTAGADFAIDRSAASKIHVNMSIQSLFFNTTKAAFGLSAANAKDYTTNAPNISFTIKDEDTDTFIYPYITGGDDGILYVGFWLNDMTSNEYVSLGVSNAGVSAGDSTTDLSQLYFVWNTDGSVTVMLGDEVKGTVKNATWTANDAYAFNRAPNPAFENGVDVGADFIYIGGYGLAGQAYYYGLDVTPIAPAGTSNIELHKNDGYTLDLGSDIGFNFYIAENPGATITVNAAGEETIYNASELTAVDGKYLIEANVAAAQMTENVSVKIVDAYGFTVFDATTTAKAYADALLADGNTKEDALVNAMLNYGGAAQTYFNYMIDKLASETAPSDALLDVNADDYKANKDGELDGITVKSATLRLEEKVVIRYYFNADSVAGMTFKCGDKVLTAEQKSEGIWYVDVEVNPQNMATEYTVTVNDTLTVTYSCMTYMTKYAADAKLGTLLKAMYDYYYAAVEYLA